MFFQLWPQQQDSSQKLDSILQHHLWVSSLSEWQVGFTLKPMKGGLYLPILPSGWSVRTRLSLVLLAHVGLVI